MNRHKVHWRLLHSLPFLIKHIQFSLRKSTHGVVDFPMGRWRFLRQLLLWWWRVCYGPMVDLPSQERITVILLSFKRPWNTEMLVRSFLRCSFVEEIIVWNNNPTHDIWKVVQVRDDRVRLVNSQDNRGTIVRHELARESPGTYFLSVDDDIFLSPEQIKELSSHLLRDPSVPHGVQGERYCTDGTWESYVFGIEGPVDVINRIYAITKEHILMFFRRLDALGIQTEGQPPADDVVRFSGGDIVLAFCGKGKPLCHNLGPFLNCPTNGTPGIAFWREPGFHEFRLKLFKRLTHMQSMPSPACGEPEWHSRRSSSVIT